jgi:hypothetical protein
MSDDQRLAAKRPGRRDLTSTGPRSGWLAVLAAAAVIGLAACGGSSSPQVASLGTASGHEGSTGSPATSSGHGGRSPATPKGNPAQLVNEWATCMRRHGDTSQADPTIDASKAIHVTMSRDIPGGIFGYSGQSGSGPGRFCLAYLQAAQTALNGGQQPQQPSQAAQLKYAKCMRADGVPDFPDPAGGGGGATNLGALDPTSPAFQNADKVCYQKTGVEGIPGIGPPQPGSVVPNYVGNAG